MSSGANDTKELDVYRKLTQFSQNSGKPYFWSLYCSKELFAAIRELLKDNHQPSDDLVGHIITTIDSALYQDCNSCRINQRRNRVSPSYGNLSDFDRSLDVLYAILRELNFEKIYKKIDGSLFCRHSFRVFIFPGYPDYIERIKGWKFLHGEFLPPPTVNTYPKRFPFDKVQHVVHNVKDLLNILHLTDSARKMDVGLQLCLKGRSHFVYNGPDLIWFSPLPPSNSNRQVCPSLNPNESRYGCFRLTLPFTVINKRYPAVYRLGTRKYNQEYCHSFLLTSSEKEVTFIEKMESIQLEKSEFVKKEDSNQLYWLCYRDDVRTAWDLVDFAVSASELNLDIKTDQIRLDFTDHSKLCVPSLKTKSSCNYLQMKTYNAAGCFLEELKKLNIEVSQLKNIFADDVYKDLLRYG